MKYVLGIVLILAYAIAFSVNLIPSIKYPDGELNFSNLIASILFLIVFVGISMKGNKKGLLVLTGGGIIAGIIVYITKVFEEIIMNNALLDTIASVQYPLYLIFITPLFGGNSLLDLGYGTYALIMSIVYLGLFILVKVK